MEGIEEVHEGEGEVFHLRIPARHIPELQGGALADDLQVHVSPVPVDIFLPELLHAPPEARPVDLHNPVPGTQPGKPLRILLGDEGDPPGLLGVRLTHKQVQFLGNLVPPAQLIAQGLPGERAPLLPGEGDVAFWGEGGRGGEVGGECAHGHRGGGGGAPQAHPPHDGGQEEAEEDIEEGAGKGGPGACAGGGLGEGFVVGGVGGVGGVQLGEGDISAEGEPADDILHPLVGEAPELWPHAHGELLHMEPLPKGHQEMPELVDEDAEPKEEYDEENLQDDGEDFSHGPDGIEWKLG